MARSTTNATPAEYKARGCGTILCYSRSGLLRDVNTAPVHRVCPVCAANSAMPYLRKHELSLVRCERCAMVYANPVPAAFASGQYYDSTGPDYYLSPAKLESDYADVRFRRELDLFERHCPGGAVLDVGCSSGAFLYQLNRRAPGRYQVRGTDVSSAPLEYAESKGIAVLRGNFPEQDLKDYDAVTFWAVLEHLAEPRRFVEKARAVLKPGGLCFVLVPNLDSLAVRLIGARYRYIYPQHLNYFSSTTLVRMVEPFFEVLELRTTHFNPIVIWQDWRSGGREVSNAERGALLKRTTALKQHRLLGPLPGLYQAAERFLATFGLADNLACVLRKRGDG